MEKSANAMTEVSNNRTADKDRRYWERHAAKYDMSLGPLGRPLPKMLELVAEAVAGKHRVLEVAAGTGLVTAALANVGGEVVATDYADAMVARLQTRARDLGLGNVDCQQADIYALPFESASFDVVVAANVLHLVPDFDAAIVALRQVLRPGGVIVAPTFCHDETRLSWLVSRLLGVTGFPGHRRFTVQSLRSSLETAGVEVRRSETLPGLIPIGFVEGAFDATALAAPPG